MAMFVRNILSSSAVGSKASAIWAVSVGSLGVFSNRPNVLTLHACHSICPETPPGRRNFFSYDYIIM